MTENYNDDKPEDKIWYKNPSMWKKYLNTIYSLVVEMLK